MYLAIMYASVVLPQPNGPVSKKARGTPVSICFLIAETCCSRPITSSKVPGRIVMLRVSPPSCAKLLLLCCCLVRGARVEIKLCQLAKGCADDSAFVFALPKDVRVLVRVAQLAPGWES